MKRVEFLEKMHELNIPVECTETYVKEISDDDIFWEIEFGNNGNVSYSVVERGCASVKSESKNEEETLLFALIDLIKGKTFGEIIEPLLEKHEELYEENFSLKDILNICKEAKIEDPLDSCVKFEEGKTAKLFVELRGENVLELEVEEASDGLFLLLQWKCYLYELAQYIDLNQEVIRLAFEMEG